ncbi:MAG: hypothetical protein Q8Q59_13060 [Luteolibacter sp.]|jgi:hypothetical protein|nr:hypothetical protein [Luteolibacter sp.]
MNFDPYDSVAWRTFGMLDAHEAALFDEEVRQDPGLRRACLELDRLAAAIAATTAEPLAPQAVQLERLQRRLGLLRGGRKCPLWLALAGWAAAGALALVCVWDRFGPAGKVSPPAIHSRPPVAASMPEDSGGKLESRRLNQEIEVLRRDLEDFHQRDRVMFQVLAGRALPLVMTMLPPGETMSSAGLRTSLTAMLGDALAVSNRAAAEQTAAIPEADADGEYVEYAEEAAAPAPTGPPMAVPIYDAARDAGTLVVGNLTPATEGKVYHLWVTTAAGTKPVYIGSLPESSASGADSFDFSLGSSMILPAGFLLTMDRAGAPGIPTEANTVLIGPPGTAR